MKKELRFGRFSFCSFVFLDLFCVVVSNWIAVLIYQNQGQANYSFSQHLPVITAMIVIDLLVTGLLNTLCRVLRRRKRKELIEAAKHVGISFAALSVILFSTKSGSDYSRVVIFLAYIIYFGLFIASHIAWKALMQWVRTKDRGDTAILITTDRFAEEGLAELRKIKFDVKYIYLLKNLNQKEINGIPVLSHWEDAGAAICWEMLKKVYIYGLEQQMVPEYLKKACWEMGLKTHYVDFNYRVLQIKTIRSEDPKYGMLSFLEGKRDIPFAIRRVYWITETEANLHRGFHAHKLNCQLLFCPYGKIDIILDDGEKKVTVSLDDPGKGLMLMPGLWREMVWKQSESILCVLASEYYDEKEYIRDYDEFISYSRRYREESGERELKQP